VVCIRVLNVVEGMVDNPNTMQAGRHEACRKSKKAMAPAKGGVLVHTVAARRRADRISIDEGLGVPVPTFAASSVPQRALNVLPQRLQPNHGKPWALPKRPQGQ
jgi:hypothetical protein